jgi:hypothetical protein
VVLVALPAPVVLGLGRSGTRVHAGPADRLDRGLLPRVHDRTTTLLGGPRPPPIERSRLIRFKADTRLRAATGLEAATRLKPATRFKAPARL